MDNEKALRLLDQLEKSKPGPRLDAILQKMRRRLSATPMADILAKVPGHSWEAKAERIGVTRQTIHLWISGETRPSNEKARKLAKLTPFSVAEIRGLDV